MNGNSENFTSYLNRSKSQPKANPGISLTLFNTIEPRKRTGSFTTLHRLDILSSHANPSNLDSFHSLIASAPLSPKNVLPKLPRKGNLSMLQREMSPSEQALSNTYKPSFPALQKATNKQLKNARKLKGHRYTRSDIVQQPLSYFVDQRNATKERRGSTYLVDRVRKALVANYSHDPLYLFFVRLVKDVRKCRKIGAVVGSDEILVRSIDLTRIPRFDRTKPLLILDLDETLIHSTFHEASTWNSFEYVSEENKTKYYVE